jgi:hypothetical protein
MLRRLVNSRNLEESYRLYFLGKTALDPEFEGTTFFRNVLYTHNDSAQHNRRF